MAHVADSPHPYSAGSPPGQLIWSEAVIDSGASSMWVHFAAFDIAPGDWVLVKDGSGTTIETHTDQGRNDLGSFWSAEVPGDTLVVELWSPGGSGAFGLAIDEYSSGFVPVSTQGVCGVNDLGDIICQALVDPTGVARGDAVARITVFADDGRTYKCTGARISSCDCDLLTTSSCITSTTEAVNANYEFFVKSATCRAPLPGGCTGEGPPGSITTGTLTTRNPSTYGLDYSLIHLVCFDEFSNARLSIDRRDPQVGWRIEAPQHAGGCALQSGAVDTATTSGWCELSSIDQTGCGTGFLIIDNLRYTCDTDFGSVGSPVIAHDSHRMIGMHHCDEVLGACNGGAVPILGIMAEIQPFLGPLPGDVSNLLVNKIRVSDTQNDVRFDWTAATDADDYSIYEGPLPQPLLGLHPPGTYGHVVDVAAFPPRGTCTTVGAVSLQSPFRGNSTLGELDDTYFLVVGKRCQAEGPFGSAPRLGFIAPPLPIPPGLGCP